MNVSSSARNLRLFLAASLTVVSMFMGASCSFETTASGLECSEEGATRDGEVCREGFWRVDDDGSGLDVGTSNDADTPDDGGASDAGEDTDLPDVPTDTGEDDVETDTSGCEPSNGGVEICDGLDNDCDGQVDGPDADGAQPFYRDADADGFGDPATEIVACSAPADYVANADDCDDSDASTNPDAPEVCDGTADNNCDQTVDENCPCTNGETRECGTDEGICQTGTQTCTNGQWDTECRNSTGPANETCDGLDNDCDGQVDNGFTDKGTSCTVGQGACESTGTYVCSQDGSGTVCDATPNSPGTEICDGIDNDCNGLTDDGFTNKGTSCTVGQGACESTGTYVCSQDGSGTVCDATPNSPGTEVCDGVDNDCDGQIDNGFTNKGTSCTVGQGACENTGVYVCTQDGSGTECDAIPGSPATTDTCGDGIDNNCDGQVDEGCYCNYNGNSDGVCAQGTIGPSGQCQRPADYEVQEGSCDGLDNDCDGEIDENLTRYMYPDADGDGYGAGDYNDGTRVCPNTPGYVDQYGDCDDGDPNTHPYAEEICDGKDNNCNGIERDAGGSDASNWCNNRYGNGASVYCGGPSNGVSDYCCEYSRDGNLGCDFETLCGNGTDEDGDGNTDCADADCDGLSCGDGLTCQSGSCQAI
ncbi:hypothetical protein FIV42_20965 [Persicimonas caeni]|uniref:Uncharacterized protein n=1 Tax=Persicimonas caeni TaxID=2292766 RepID=A0A4Y6PXR1_PERCE|nr:putative metal-binding motif-containing protein [Persicimonas caeni]QDG53122.1 hypothetical protein FIV42_20965 [Persicimonas caeni]QED34344.1 hypothetical protein FRD00_20960 [Persicimonas caeni]